MAGKLRPHRWKSKSKLTGPVGNEVEGNESFWGVTVLNHEREKDSDVKRGVKKLNLGLLQNK